jgi:uncharacterized protein (DUF779 family)
MSSHDEPPADSPGVAAGLRVPHFAASRAALDALHTLRRSRGRQVVVLSPACARVSVAHVHSEVDYVPRPGEVRLGTLAHCPIYADPRSVETCPHDGLVLDLHAADRRGPAVFVTRPESAAERQQRVFSHHTQIG